MNRGNNAEVCYDVANNENAMWMPTRHVRHATIIGYLKTARNGERDRTAGCQLRVASTNSIRMSRT